MQAEKKSILPRLKDISNTSKKMLYYQPPNKCLGFFFFLSMHATGHRRGTAFRGFIEFLSRIREESARGKLHEKKRREEPRMQGRKEAGSRREGPREVSPFARGPLIGPTRSVALRTYIRRDLKGERHFITPAIDKVFRLGSRVRDLHGSTRKKWSALDDIKRHSY